MKMSKLFLRLIVIFGVLITFAGSLEAGNVDLTITFTDSPDPVSTNSPVTYTIKLANGNLERADNVKVTVPLPTGTTYVSGCSLVGSNVVCDYGGINKNTNETLSFIVTSPSSAGTMSATATITTSDTNTLSNTSTITTTVNAVGGFTCPNPRAFASVANISLYGNSRIIGNTNMCKNDNGVCGDPGSARNNDINMMYSDPDGAGDLTTFNASSALLDLPVNATVRWAKLYWQGYLVNKNDTVKNSSKSIKFALPGQAYQTIDSSNSHYDYNWIYFTADRYYYQGSADVTALVQSGGEGYYTVANIVSEIGQPIGGSYGAWSLVIVYDDPNETFRNVTVFDGYQGIVTSGDQTTATAYANANGCGSNTGARNTMTIPLSGFLTPKSGTVNSSLSVFAGEGDKGATGDHLALTDANGVSRYVANGLNPYDDIFNSTITYNGAPVTNTTTPVAVTPWYSANSNGIDIDTFNVATDKDGNPLIGNNQTSTNVTLDTSGDGYMPGVFAFSTELYTPKFCYDYGYEQNGLPFTEENNGTKLPYISGYLPNTADINVSIYIRNQENSDISANNVMLNINDINASEAIYKRNSVAVTYPNQFVPTAKTDAAWPLIVSDTYIHNIPLGNIAGSEYAYAYYGLTPQAVGDINMSIVGTFSYDLTITLPNGTTLTLPYSSTIGGSRLPMCSSNNFSYTPEWGIFSVVNAGLYDSATANRYYDLTTQVAKRPGNFRVASFEKSALDTPKPVSTAVAVELIDASQFHDTDAACQEPSSAVSPRIWVTFDNNVSQINFNKDTIAYAITNGMVSDAITGKPITLANAEDFYKTATPNAAFRVSYNATNDGNQSLVQIAPGTPSTNTQILNFTQLVQDVQHCAQPVEIPSNPGNTTTLVSVACGNAGNQGIDKHNFAICMECLYGYNTTVLCSRDNFAIRPESYTVTLKDINQANHTVTQTFAPDHTGVDTPNLAQVDVAGGYDYRFDINATNHIDNSNTPGYTRYFGTANNDYNVTFVWEPSTPKSGCNDTSNKPQTLTMINGAVAAEQNLSQVGEYRLDIIDKRWTAVDWDSALQTHQVGSHFLSGPECIPSSADVPAQATAIGLSGTTITNRVGCDTSSIHDNVDNHLKYRDYYLTFHPYKFDMSSINFGVGTLPKGIVAGGSDFAYMADISRNDSMNMSVRATGNVNASGYNGTVLTNFVTDCYARDLDFYLTSDNNLTLANTSYQIRFMDFNSTNGLIYDSNATNINTSKLTMPLMQIGNGNYKKDTAGSLSTISRFNYDRNVTQTLNPITARFSQLDINCTTPAECTMQADLTAAHKAIGNRAMDFNVTYAYGRIIPRDIRVFGTAVDAVASAWYEVYNAPTLAATALPPSRNAPLWYINTLQDDLIYGDGIVTQLQTAGAASVALVPPVSGGSVLGVETYNFGPHAIGSYKAHIDTDPWLWYGANALDYVDPVTGNTEIACLTHPCFNINVVPNIGRAGSSTGVNLQSDKANKGTTPSGTKVIYDYTPATR